MSTEFLVSKRPASEPYLGRLPARALVPAPLVKEAGAFPPRLGAPALPDCYAAGSGGAFPERRLENVGVRPRSRSRSPHPLHALVGSVFVKAAYVAVHDLGQLIADSGGQPVIVGEVERGAITRP